MKSPSDWRKLPCDKQIHPLVVLYIKKFTNEKVYGERGLTPCYFKLRSFFERLYDKETPQFMNKLYEYLWYEEAKPLGLSDFIREAKLRQQRLIDEQIKKITTGKNEKVTLKDVLG